LGCAAAAMAARSRIAKTRFFMRRILDVLIQGGKCKWALCWALAIDHAARQSRRRQDRAKNTVEIG
jgi:hypothetical protein